MDTLIDQKIDDAKGQVAEAQENLWELMEQRKQIQKASGIEKWLGNRFASSTGATPEFNAFTKDFKRTLKKELGNGFELVKWNKGHFYISAFARNLTNQKLAYLSISDVRYFPDSWFDNILIRTAEHEKDYTGGSNHYTKFGDIQKSARFLTQ